MLAPVGTWPAVPSCRLKVKVFAGISSSVAVAVKVKGTNSSMFLFPITPSTGATLTSFTVTVICSSSQSTGEPLSQTLTLKVYSPGPWASVGVQLKRPLVELIDAPVGALSKL